MKKVDQNIKVAVDAVVFGYYKNKLQLLLIQQKYGEQHNIWALPGGFIKDDESLDGAVIRELREETGIQANYMEQLYSFGKVHRDTRFRVVSVAYLALINPRNFILKADSKAKDVQWFDMDNLPNIAYDHLEIAMKGWERLKAKFSYQPIGFELLKEKFPFSDLENLYQTILDRKIDRRNFRKKIMSYNILQETDEYYKPGSGRPAKLFKFKKDQYDALEKEGFHFDIKFA